MISSGVRPNHFLRLRAHREDGIVGLHKRHDRGLVDDESLAGHKNNGVSRAQSMPIFLPNMLAIIGEKDSPRNHILP